jgi:hypothetical protein
MFCEGAGCVKCNAKGDDPCDGYDNDCDGIIDDGPKSDYDGDGYTYCGKISPATGKQTLVDCNDDDKTISPAGHEICNGKDDNCDGIIDNPNLVCPANETCVPTTGQCISNTQVCDTTNCPSPKVCDPTTQQCVLPSSQDAGSTGCTSNEQCTTGICATSTELGPGQQPVCTQPCCTSADCASGYVCYGAGTGGNYCVAPAAGTRGSLGSNTPGASCGGNGDCRSGVCTAGKCHDVREQHHVRVRPAAREHRDEPIVQLQLRLHVGLLPELRERHRRDRQHLYPRVLQLHAVRELRGGDAVPLLRRLRSAGDERPRGPRLRLPATERRAVARLPRQRRRRHLHEEQRLLQQPLPHLPLGGVLQRRVLRR